MGSKMYVSSKHQQIAWSELPSKLLKDDYKILKNFKFSENHKFQKMGEVWH